MRAAMSARRAGSRRSVDRNVTSLRVGEVAVPVSQSELSTPRARRGSRRGRSRRPARRPRGLAARAAPGCRGVSSATTPELFGGCVVDPDAAVVDADRFAPGGRVLAEVELGHEAPGGAQRASPAGRRCRRRRRHRSRHGRASRGSSRAPEAGPVRRAAMRGRGAGRRRSNPSPSTAATRQRRHRLDVGDEVVRGREAVPCQFDSRRQHRIPRQSPVARVRVAPRPDGARDGDRHRSEERHALVTLGTQPRGAASRRRSGRIR